MHKKGIHKGELKKKEEEVRQVNRPDRRIHGNEKKDVDGDKEEEEDLDGDKEEEDLKHPPRPLTLTLTLI